jgi:putative ABC transport system permease protein
LIAVISDRLWRSRYHADPALVGKQLQLNGEPYTIVGVMPAGFNFPGDIDVWQRSRWDFHNHSRAAHFMESVFRLAPGVDLPQADAAARAMAARLEKDFPATNRAWGIRLSPLAEDQLGYYRPALIVLFGAVGLLIVIGCLNVASLLLTRALSREREVAVRTALGASPRHLVVQLLAEAGVLSVAGAILGTLAATVALPLILSSTSIAIPRLQEATVTWRVLGFALAVAAGTTMVFGVVPAIVLMRRNLTMDLKTGERGSSRASRAIYRGLVGGEVALACVLLVSSGLLVRTVTRMTNVPIGVGSPQAVTASVQLTGGAGTPAFNDWGAVATTFGQILEHVRSRPGVRAAGGSNFLPLDPGWRVPFAVEGQPPVRAEEAPQAQYHSVTEGYFEAMGAGLAGGRFFTAQDTADTAGVVVVNETFVRRYFPSEPAVGHVIVTRVNGIGPLGRNLMYTPAPAPPAGAPPPPPRPPARFEIVGVVRDLKNVALSQPTEPAIFFQARQFPFRTLFFAVEGTDVPAFVAAIQSALRQFAPGIPLGDVQTWADRARARSAEPRLLMAILLCFGALAGILAALGVYGLFSWTIALRRRELAIRLTLGARPAGIGALVFRQAIVLIGVGLAVGWVLVRLAGNLLSRVLFDVTPGDLPSTATAIAVLLVASLIACIPPALRAMGVDPVDGLRVE